MTTAAVILGVLGDTHGRGDACRRGVELLQDLGATHLVHTGDIGDGEGGRAVLDALAGMDCRFVWGNNDWGKGQLAPYARDLGLVALQDFGRFELAGTTIVVAHGDDLRRLRRLESGADPINFDLLLTGHSHLPHDERLGPARWVNPGALFRCPAKTVATIDLARLEEPSAVLHHTLDGL